MKRNRQGGALNYSHMKASSTADKKKKKRIVAIANHKKGSMKLKLSLLFTR